MNSLFHFMDEDEGQVAEQRNASLPGRFVPRPYQLAALDAVLDKLERADRTGIYMATGTGKTDLVAMIIKKFLLQNGVWTGGALIITPRRNLVNQTCERMKRHGIPCGVEMASIESDEVHTVTCDKTILKLNRQQKFYKRIKIVFVDEAHLAMTPAMLATIKRFREWGAKIVALTATPIATKRVRTERTDWQEVARQEEDTHKDIFWQEHYGEPAYCYSYQDAVRDGYLCPAKIFMLVLESLDVSKFRLSMGGDFNQKQTSSMLREHENVTAVGLAVAQYHEGLPTVVFASSIAQARAIAEDLFHRGIEAVSIDSNMTSEESAMHLDRFMSGEVSVIINVGMLTLGWDAPFVRKIFIARCCGKLPLYAQVIGRGTRLYPADVIANVTTAEGRRAAIAASDKPWFEVYDLTDSSRSNDLKCAIDLVRPGLRPDLLRRVKDRIIRSGGGISIEDIDPVIREEAAAAAAEERARKEWELRRRSHLVGAGQVRAYERDTFADAEQKDRGEKKTDIWWMPFGRFAGKSFKVIHAQASWYLPKILPHIKDQDLARNVRRFLHSKARSN